MQTIWGIRI